MFGMVIANILGLFIFFFLLWKTLKDDYQYEKIFNFAFFILFGLFFGLLISKYLAGIYWFWLTLSGSIIGFIISLIRQKMKFYESFEAFVISLLPWISLIYLADSINKSSLSSFLMFWMGLICISLFFFFKSFYRSFTWYKSGRVGFSGLSAALIFFLFRALISFLFPNILSLVGRPEIFLSGSAALLTTILLYNLSINKEK